MCAQLTSHCRTEYGESKSLSQSMCLIFSQILYFVSSDRRLQHPQMMFDASTICDLLKNILQCRKKEEEKNAF